MLKTVVEPLAPRASLLESPGKLRLSIPSPRSIPKTAFISLWLLFWLFTEVLLVLGLLAPRLGSVALMDNPIGGPLFFVAWTLGGLTAVYIFLWMLVGRELVQVDGEYLAIKRAVFGLGRERKYRTRDVQDLRVSPQAPRNSSGEYWGLAGGVIAFDYGAATIRFGAALQEGEAKAIVERLRTAWPTPA